jgi:predicted MPP superfamily phosphohydrolase
VLVIAVGLQVPLLWALGRLTGHPGLLVIGAGLLTAAFISSFLGPRSVWGAPSRARLYLTMWPFFLWWTVAMLFAVLLLPALLVAAVLPVGKADALSVAIGLAVVGALFALRQRPRVRAHEVFVSGLPAAFDGYRIAQISDLHVGPFAGAARVASWVAAANNQGADLVVATGDFIASGSSFVPVVAAAFQKLVARDGAFACMGNHDYFTDGDALADAIERAGVPVLRNRGVDIRRDGAVLHLAGVDDTWTRRANVGQALSGRPSGAPVILLAHDPMLFPEAARAGVDLTLSGHTHGGQLALPFFAKRWNLARVFTGFTTGLYRAGESTLYVNRGLGTTGPPIRIAVPPEIAVLTLRPAPATA